MISRSLFRALRLPTGAAIGLYLLVNGARVSAADTTTATPAASEAPSMALVITYGVSTMPGEVIESPPPPPSEAVEYYAIDAIGSIRIVYAPDGTVMGRSDYLPFGEEVSGSNMPRFTGKERDPEAGLDNFGARYYASRIGRFSSSDPAFAGALFDPQQWNRYAYARNNPLSFVDSTGLWAEFSDTTTVYGTYDPWNLTLPGGSFPGWAAYLNQYLECGARVCVEKPELGQPGTAATDSPESGGDPGDGGTNGGTNGGNNGGTTGGTDGGATTGSDDGPKKPSGRLTTEQCHALQVLLNREQQFGTIGAAHMSSLTYGDGRVLLASLDSEYTPNLQTPVGEIDIDWYTEVVRGSAGTQTGAWLVYAVGKPAWTVFRMVTGARIGHYLPFRDWGETNALIQIQLGRGYADIFPPTYMAQACPQ